MNERQKKKKNEKKHTQKNQSPKLLLPFLLHRIPTVSCKTKSRQDNKTKSKSQHKSNFIHKMINSCVVSFAHTCIQVVESNDKAEMLLIFPDIYTENSVNNNDNTRFESIVRDFV